MRARLRLTAPNSAYFSPSVVSARRRRPPSRVLPIRTRRARRRDNRQRGRPSSISPRETSTQVAQVPRAHRAPSAQGERAPRIRPAPHTRKKTKGRRWSRDAFYQPSARARRAIPTLFFSPTPLDGITGMFSRVCAVRVSLVRVLAARGARSRDRPPSRFPTLRGELFGKRLVGFFREIPGDGRAGCSTRARAHFDPGFFRMKPPWVLRTTVRFLAYYTRHSRVRCGANDHPS